MGFLWKLEDDFNLGLKKKINSWPRQCGSVVECEPMNQDVQVQFLVRIEPRVTALSPVRGMKKAAG